MIKLIKNFFSQGHKWRSLIVSILIIIMLISPLEAKAFNAADLGFALSGAGGGAKVGLLTCGAAALVPLVGQVTALGCAGIVALASLGGAVIGYFAGDTLAATVINVIAAIVTFMGGIVVNIFLNFSTMMLEMALNLNLLKVTNFEPLGSLTGFTTGIANLFLVAILIIVALATIVGIESYGMRKLLPMLIATALVVNFSTVLVGLVADSGSTALRFFWYNSNIKNVPLSAYVLRNMKITEFNKGSAALVEKLLGGTQIEGAKKTSKALVNAALSVVIIAVGFLAGYIFLRLAILMFLRLGVFWLLIIIAPVAFILGILPIGRGYLKEWWKQLINWSFLGGIVLFFIFLGLLIWTEVNKMFTAIPINGKLVNLDSMSLVYVTPIVLLFFIYALNVSKKMAGAAANAVVDSVIGLGKAVIIGGAAFGAGAALAGAGGALLRRNFVRNAGEALQRAGFRKTGARLLKAREDELKRTGEEVGTTAGAYEDSARFESDTTIQNAYERTRNPRNRMAFIQALIKEGRDLTPQMRADTLRYGSTLAPEVRKQVRESYTAIDTDIYEGGDRTRGFNYRALMDKLKKARQPQRIRFEGFDTDTQRREAFLLLSTTLDRGDLHRIADDSTTLNRFTQQINDIQGLSSANRDQLLNDLATRSGFERQHFEQVFQQMVDWRNSAAQRRAAFARGAGSTAPGGPGP